MGQLVKPYQTSMDSCKREENNIQIGIHYCICVHVCDRTLSGVQVSCGVLCMTN